MRKSLLLCASLLVSVSVLAAAPICDPEMDSVQISECIHAKLKSSQFDIKMAYDKAMGRVTNKTALAKNQSTWYGKTQDTCEKIFEEDGMGTNAPMDLEGCLYDHNIKRIKYLNSL